MILDCAVVSTSQRSSIRDISLLQDKWVFGRWGSCHRRLRRGGEGKKKEGHDTMAS